MDVLAVLEIAMIAVAVVVLGTHVAGVAFVMGRVMLGGRDGGRQRQWSAPKRHDD